MAVYKRDIVDINLETGNIHRSFLKHSIGYKDQKADHFGIRTFRDGVPVDLTGVSVQGIFMPPQGDPIAITSGNIVSGNVAEVVLPQACYNYDGQFCLSIKLVDSNNSVTGTMRIVDGMVDNTHASGTVAPTSEVPTYQEILSTYDAMVAATAAANGAIAATYSSSSTYKVGDYCIHDGGLYRCTTAITTAEAWTSGHWTAAKIGPDVSELKSALQNGLLFAHADTIPVHQGVIQMDTGLPDSSYSKWCYTDYLGYDAVLSYKTTKYIKMFVLAYNKNGDYVGQWHGSSFVQSYDATTYFYNFDVHEWLKLYPEYQFKLNFYVNSSTDITPADVLDKVNVSRFSYNEISALRENLLNIFLSPNVIPFAYYSGDDTTKAGIHFVKGADGAIYSSGLCTGAARYYWVYGYPIDAGNYIISGVPNDANGSKLLQYVVCDIDHTPSVSEFIAVTTETTGIITVGANKKIYIRTDYATNYTDNGTYWRIKLVKQEAAINLNNNYNIRKIVSDISQLSSAVSALTPMALPEYWLTYLAGKKSDIFDEVCNVGNHGISFAFFTDYHYKNSDSYYLGFSLLPSIFKYIKKNMLVSDIICGGDILDSHATKAEALSILETFRSDYAELGVKCINGNHETNPYGSVPVEYDDLYAILYHGMGMEEEVQLQPDLYWYKDNRTQKVRIIAPNTRELNSQWYADTAQHQWLVDTLTSTPDGYTVIVIPHIFFTLSDGVVTIQQTGTEIKTLVDAFANKTSGVWYGISYDFTNTTAEVACILTGHVHNDASLISDAGYPIIATVCDAVYGSNQSVTRGNSAKNTINEHAFDIVCIDTDAKTIKCKRIGSGSDRTFTYGE